MSTTLSELTCLGLARPGPGSASAEVATFFGEVAAVHERLAAEATGAEARRERYLAACARLRARRYLEGLA